MESFPRTHWNNQTFCDLYCDEVNRNFQTLALPDINSRNKENAKDRINNLCNNICDILHIRVRASLQQFGTVKKPRHNKRWWNADCVKAKKRNKLFHKIWKESQKPKKGLIYENYKYAKKCYRKACKQAVNQHSNRSVININKLFKAKKAAEMWKLIRKTKPREQINKDATSMDALKIYFESKFAKSDRTSDYIKSSEVRVAKKYERLCDSSELEKVVVSSNKET